MAADEIFVLVLVLVCVVAAVALEVRSRRHKNAAGAAQTPEVGAAVADPEPIVGSPRAKGRDSRR